MKYGGNFTDNARTQDCCKEAKAKFKQRFGEVLMVKHERIELEMKFSWEGHGVLALLTGIKEKSSQIRWT
jgi:hypothetical protein